MTMTSEFIQNLSKSSEIAWHTWTPFVVLNDHALMFDNLMVLKEIEDNFILSTPNETIHFVATLALGSRLRQRGCKGAGQEKARESHHILPRV